MKFNNDYIENLTKSTHELKLLDFIPISKLKTWFKSNRDYRFRVYEERKKITAVFPIDDIYPKEIPTRELRFYLKTLSDFDILAYQLNSLYEFVKVAELDDFFEKEYNVLVDLRENKALIKKWLIRNEEAFFKVFLFGIDYCIEQDENSSEVHYEIYLDKLGGKFKFSNDDFKGLTRYWKAYNHYFFIEELYTESEHFIG